MPIEESQFLGILGIDGIVPSDHEIIAVNADPSLTEELLGTKRNYFIIQSAAENSRREAKIGNVLGSIVQPSSRSCRCLLVHSYIWESHSLI